MIWLLYWLLWALFRSVGVLLFRLRVAGVEHVPKEGGLIIAANHASYLDIPVLGAGVPRRVAYLGRHDLFRPPAFSRLLQSLGWIPLRHGRMDRVGFATAIGLLRDGHAVVIYPEGTRSWDGRLGQGKPGIGILVAETRCPVLPVYIGGTYEVLPRKAWWPRFRPVRLVIGEPIDFREDHEKYTGKEYYQHVSRTVMARIAELGQVANPTALPDDPASRPAGKRANRPEQTGNAEQNPVAEPFQAE